MITIALDAMGGDLGSEENILGAIQFVQETNANVVLVGQESIIHPLLEKHGVRSDARISVVHASEVVSMEDSPTQSYRAKKDSSIQVGLRLVQEKNVDAFASSGNTGAVMAAATFILGRCKHVERPALSAILPTDKEPLIMLDMGSNVDCKPSYLKQFAVMGSLFSELAFKKEKPKVSLLNIGEETYKGDSLTQTTHQLLSDESRINFVGNIEGRYILKGDVDVVVCDGFVGNSLLKFGEGVSSLFFDFFKQQWKTSLLSKIGLMLLSPALKAFKKKYDYQETGGAPLLGVNGVAIVAHGKSHARAIKNALIMAKITAETNIVEKVAAAFAESREALQENDDMSASTNKSV